MEKEKIQNFINKDYIYAIVGATENPEKYGYKVLADLKDKGFNVIPVNPKYQEIVGLTCYPDLISMDDRPDVVVLIVGEKNAEKVVQNCIDLKLNKIWFQPGSEYEEAVNLAKKEGFDVMLDKCIMRETEILR